MSSAATRNSPTINDLLAVSIRIRVAGFATHWSESGGGYTRDNLPAQDVCEQELELNLAPDQDLVFVLSQMAEAVEEGRLYGWMAQYRADLALGAGEIAPEAEAALYPVSAELAAPLRPRALRGHREHPSPAERDHSRGASPELGRSSAKARDAAPEAGRHRPSHTPAASAASRPARGSRRKTSGAAG